jgi:phosphohistidine phosphatase SixA
MVRRRAAQRERADRVYFAASGRKKKSGEQKDGKQMKLKGYFQISSLGQKSKLLLPLVCAFALASVARAQPPVIFLVRHAERAAISGHVPSDTGLSREGKARAADLAQALRDAQITAIYTSEFKRTKETAEPLAQSLGIRPEVVQSDDFRTLIAKLRALRGNALVVGHSNTLPQIINALGVASRVTVAETEHDNLFVVILDRSPRLIHLRYR